MNIAVITVSDSRTHETDGSGKYLKQQIEQSEHEFHEKLIVKDDIYQIRAMLSAWIADVTVNAVILTGGTGITGRDCTPEAVLPLLDKTIDGFGEVFRMLSYEQIKTSTIQSRALAGIANSTIIFCIPGSTGACKDAWEGIISQQLDISYKPCNLAQLLPRFSESQ